jgi:hypothetical protein
MTVDNGLRQLMKSMQQSQYTIPDIASQRQWDIICSVHPMWSCLPNELRVAIRAYLRISAFIFVPVSWHNPYYPTNIPNPWMGPPTPSKKERKKKIAGQWPRRQQQWEKQNKRWK